MGLIAAACAPAPAAPTAAPAPPPPATTAPAVKPTTAPAAPAATSAPAATAAPAATTAAVAAAPTANLATAPNYPLPSGPVTIAFQHGSDVTTTKLPVDGAFGMRLPEMLRQACNFLKYNTQEFLILKFDKCTNWRVSGSWKTA